MAAAHKLELPIEEPALEPPQWRRPFLVWLDGVERGWAVPVLLAGFVAAWFLFLCIAYTNADLHPDTLEAWTAGRMLEWGGFKHPPLMGWAARLWTTIFPATDQSFYLLALVNAALALAMIDVITRHFVRGDKRAIVLLLLLLLPVYQFQAPRFNANTILFASWPLALYCFLRSFETRTLLWAAAAGAASALAILGKYYSAFLVAGFVFAAICHPSRKLYFRSLAPWVSAAVGVVVLGPHFYWFAKIGISPFDYALAAHGGRSFGRSAVSALAFVPGILATLALPVVVFGFMIRGQLKTYGRQMLPLDPGLLLLLLIAVGSVLAPAIVTAALRSEITSIWAAQGLFLFIVVMVCSAKFPIDRTQTVNLAAIVVATTLLAILIAPAHAWYRNTHPFKEGRNYYRLAAEQLTKKWRETSSVPLKNVSGETLAMTVGFYGDDHPIFALPNDLTGAWQIPPQNILNQGWATLCLPSEPSCLDWSKAVAAATPGAVMFNFVVAPSLWGRPGTPSEIYGVLVAPNSAR